MNGLKSKKLKEIVDHHVKEEEGSLFRQAKNILSDEDAYRLKELMHYLKMQLKLNKEKSSLGLLMLRTTCLPQSLPS